MFRGQVEITTHRVTCHSPIYYCTQGALSLGKTCELLLGPPHGSRWSHLRGAPVTLIMLLLSSGLHCPFWALFLTLPQLQVFLLKGWGEAPTASPQLCTSTILQAFSWGNLLRPFSYQLRTSLREATSPKGSGTLWFPSCGSPPFPRCWTGLVGGPDYFKGASAVPELIHLE